MASSHELTRADSNLKAFLFPLSQVFGQAVLELHVQHSVCSSGILEWSLEVNTILHLMILCISRNLNCPYHRHDGIGLKGSLHCFSLPWIREQTSILVSPCFLKKNEKGLFF